jgi:hypothetical protein
MALDARIADIERIFLCSKTGRDVVMQQPLRDAGLESRRILARTRALPDVREYAPTHDTMMTAMLGIAAPASMRPL